MIELLNFLNSVEIWIYVLAGIVVIIFLRRMLLAWSEWRAALFGLERETAHRRFRSSLSILAFAIVFAAVEFIIATFVSPAVAQLSPLPTPTVDFAATPLAGILNPAGGTQAAPTESQLSPTQGASLTEGCVAGQIEWTFPKSGEKISGTVELKGTVNVPNLGFFKYEYSQPGGESWTTIAAGNGSRVDAPLGGMWNTELLTPGDYLLRIVVADNANNLFPTCLIQIQVVAP